MNMVNKAFAEAAESTQAELRAHLIEVVRPVYKDQAPDMVDRMADFMGRHVAPPLEQ